MNTPTSLTPVSALGELPALQELHAPKGWTALVLQQSFPLARWEDGEVYRAARALLLDRLTDAAVNQEVLFLFDRCRPGLEVRQIRENARAWQPEFGVGIWVDSSPPVTWTREYLLDTPEDQLRPPIERCVLIKRSKEGHTLAERLFAGSGALMQVWLAPESDFLAEVTETLRPTISDISLTSFPYYFPLFRASTLLRPDRAYDLPQDDLLPGVTAYARESREDGGLLLLVRQEPARFFSPYLEEKSLPFVLHRITGNEAL